MDVFSPKVYQVDRVQHEQSNPSVQKNSIELSPEISIASPRHPDGKKVLNLKHTISKNDISKYYTPHKLHNVSKVHDTNITYN